MDVSIHAPRAGGDARRRSHRSVHVMFQSTPPARGATTWSSSFCPAAAFQSTPPARGATVVTHHRRTVRSYVSIHAPRAGGDRHDAAQTICDVECFNPRPPRGGRPVRAILPITWIAWFQSTPPARGATMTLISECGQFGMFQSTPPARGATCRRCSVLAVSQRVSIHAPRAGGDRHLTRYTSASIGRFNPRPPRGGRLAATSICMDC